MMQAKFVALVFLVLATFATACEENTITGLVLVDAKEDVDIGGIVCCDGFIYVNPKQSITIRADICGADDDSSIDYVIFTGDFSRKELNAPYAVAGDTTATGDYYYLEYEIDVPYSIVATPYNSNSVQGTPKVCTFTFKDKSQVDPPQSQESIARKEYLGPHEEELNDTPLSLPDGTETNLLDFLRSNRVIGNGATAGAVVSIYATASEIIDYKPECRDRNYGYHSNPQTDVVCDVYDAFLQVCELEEECDVDEFKTYKLQTGKGSILYNTDAAVETICYVDLLRDLGFIFGNPFCPDAAKDEIRPQVNAIQDVIVNLVPEGVDNPLFTYDYGVATPQDVDGANEASFVIGDAALEYRNHIDEAVFGGANVGQTGFVLGGLVVLFLEAQKDITCNVFCETQKREIYGYVVNAVIGYLLEKYSDILLTPEEYNNLEDYFKFVSSCARFYGAKKAKMGFSLQNVIDEASRGKSFIGSYPTCCQE